MKNLLSVFLLCAVSVSYAGFDEGALQRIKKAIIKLALKEFKKRLSKAMLSAQFSLGQMYDKGEGVTQD
jgi:TPR repeat protein